MTENETDLDNYLDDLLEWPQHWMLINDDMSIGQQLLTVFDLFIATIMKDGRSAKTIKKHVAHLHLLGSEIVRRLHDGDEANLKLPPKQLILEYIDEEYGPLVHYWDPNNPADEAHQKAFDSTCRKLYKFILASK